MNNKQIKQIIDQTKNFYKSVEKEFSSTRQYSWKGWYSILPIIENLKPNSVLDLGCGNGRFYRFLKNNKIKCKYRGYDTNEFFIKEAKNKYPEAKFEIKDILDVNKLNTTKADLIVGFGITHHIPDAELRTKWFQNLVNLGNKESIYILTFWNKDNETPAGDYELDFANLGQKRYYHKYNDTEITTLMKNAQIINEFNADGKNNEQNKYVVFSFSSL